MSWSERDEVRSSGKHFELAPTESEAVRPASRLGVGNFLLTSDSVLPTLTRRPDMQAIIGQLPPPTSTP